MSYVTTTAPALAYSIPVYIAYQPNLSDPCPFTIRMPGSFPFHFATLGSGRYTIAVTSIPSTVWYVTRSASTPGVGEKVDHRFASSAGNLSGTYRIIRICAGQA